MGRVEGQRLVKLATDLDSVVCLGAHPDDIEIGAAGTLLRLAETATHARFHFIVATGSDERAGEAKASATDLLPDRIEVTTGRFTDGYLPYEQPSQVKKWLAMVSDDLRPDLVLVPNTDDRHQDHRFLGSLAWQIFRRTTILEYEIPKWDGDQPSVNFFVPLGSAVVKKKIEHLLNHFESQHDKAWFDPIVFEGQARLRGVEAGTDYAEGFAARKLILG